MAGKPRKEKLNEVSPRIHKLREELLKTKPEVFADRAVLITESYLETIGQPYILRRAKAFDKVLRNMRLYIREGELIAGNLAEKPWGAPVFPEYDVGFLLAELDTIEVRRTDRFKLSDENKEILRSLLHEWKENTLKAQALNIFPAEAREAASDLISMLTALGSGVGHMIVDYGLVLEKGILQLKKEAEELKENVGFDSLNSFQQVSYYNAVIIVCDAVMAYAERFSDYAGKLAQTEEDPIRKRELEMIAANCRKVPAFPAQNFWEALQSFWFIHVILQLESNGHSVSPGRFDQYMYPYYKEDLEKGTISSEYAEELLHCLWIKFNEINKVRDKVSSVAFAGYPMYQNLILGGVTKEGEDAVNPLSYLCMEATEKVGLPQPSLSVRWHSSCQDRFLQRALEVSSYGMGLPAFFNDEVLVPIMAEQGHTMEEARDYAIVGCVEPAVPGISESWLTGGFINLAKFLELTINNGFDPVFNKQRAFRTGEVEEFKTFEQFKEAYFKQLSHYLRLHVLCDNILEGLHAGLCPTPFQSLLTHDCLKNAKTTLEGGARYNTITINAVGFANVVDAFAAIKKLVYEEKRISLTELKEILLKDFNGYEDIRQMFLNSAPKFGNDEEYADQLGVELLEGFSAEIGQYANVRGGKYTGALYSIACHVLLADKVGATPDGRKGSMLLADGGVSCAQGRDKQGPTAVFNSVARLDHHKSPGGALLNMKFNPSLLKTEEGIKKVSDMVKTFFMKKGQHVQFNVVDLETLRDAQKHPENHPMLVVRMAGFSVLFNTLDKLAQEDVIQRTEHTSG